jgi:hypothetical protein
VPATKTNVAVTDKGIGTAITPLPVSGPQPGDRIRYEAKCKVPVDHTGLQWEVTDGADGTTAADVYQSSTSWATDPINVWDPRTVPTSSRRCAGRVWAGVAPSPLPLAAAEPR